ncbi:adenylyltransferase/cytidyltransferase family protein [Shewanella sp. NIFS-20-20]|uniref:adenylyltransferase/cytidyltransferase family protein n=1 Tax=Shewanella sp. NIFS-20-20 TaxID=2853806 RepID=UPI001C4658DC|nr:adenylyltransferase/cytidyltransferase family protein [Shewanella sp. NIFS-20-20]MBV7316382.1 adenylyltransferase/cytidyltransferase family protein [Shewanella sp. NIFS-20-20]
MTAKIVVTYGTFDIFHVGHLRLLQRAKSLGDKLYVFVSSDEFNQAKGKLSLFPYEQRAEIVAACGVVDGVFPEHSWDQKIEDIQTLKASTFVIGDDWRGQFDFLTPYCEVVYLARTDGISSSHVKQAMTLINNLNKAIG